MEVIFGFISNNPELMSGIAVLLVSLLGLIGKKYTKFKKYSDVMVTAIETAKSSKNVKNIVKNLSEEDTKINTKDFVNFVKEVVEKTKV